MFKSLRLERFKNFKDAKLELGPFTLLIGANASGKSNIRDAFRFLHGIARGYNLTEIIGEKYAEGGERVWTGIRGGATEIAFSGEDSFSISSRYYVSLGIPEVQDRPCQSGLEILALSARSRDRHNGSRCRGFVREQSM